MNKTGKFAVPHQEPGRVHLYKVEGSGVRKGFTPAGTEWNEFEVDLFADEDPTECAACGKGALTGWRCSADSRELCKGCVDVHAAPFEPCVMFHKFSRRCWDEAKGGWTEEREKATVYTHLAAAATAREDFLGVVQKAILVVPVEKFDEVLKEYAEAD